MGLTVRTDKRRHSAPPPIFKLTKINNMDKELLALIEVRKTADQLIKEMDDYSLFLDGYRNGSASISEVNASHKCVEETKSKLFDLIKATQGK